MPSQQAIVESANLHQKQRRPCTELVSPWSQFPSPVHVPRAGVSGVQWTCMYTCESYSGRQPNFNVSLWCGGTLGLTYGRPKAEMNQ